MFLKWDNEIVTGIEEIDQQHIFLFEKINHLIETLEIDGSDNNFFAVIDELKKYALEHFTSEEKYFDKYEYPNKDEHIKEHRSFESKIVEIEEKGKIFGSAIHLSIELNAYLLNWWYIHIKNHDKKLAAFLQNINQEQNVNQEIKKSI